jgi:DNA-binding response OmpR family regulator
VKTVDLAVVLLDIRLLNGDGPAVFETIQATAPLLPVNVLTAVRSKDYRAKSLFSGPFSCLTKPYNRDELCAVHGTTDRGAAGRIFHHPARAF